MPIKIDASVQKSEIRNLYLTKITTIIAITKLIVEGFLKRSIFNFCCHFESIEKYMTVNNKFNLITETGEQNINQNTKYDLFSSYEDFFNCFSYLINSKKTEIPNTKGKIL